MPKKSKKQISAAPSPEEKRQKYLRHIVQSMPLQPGVYRMKSADGTVLYVGKAKSLKNRVSSYFQSQRDMPAKNISMMKQVADLDYTVVRSDLEAVMMETNLIKELRPKYNILMKDDKNYVYIKITTDEAFPRIIVTRHLLKDKARYFGPKTAQHKVVKTLKVLKRIFPFRHCQLDIQFEDKPNRGTFGSLKAPTAPLRGAPTPAATQSAPADGRKKYSVKVTRANIKYPCIDYHIKRCVGPCIGTVTPQEYRKIIDKVIGFLEGKHEEVLQSLRQEMAQAAALKKFEVAANIRDKIQAVEDITEKQRISAADHRDTDVINYHLEEKEAFFNLFQVRNGKLINQENFTVKTGTFADTTSAEPTKKGAHGATAERRGSPDAEPSRKEILQSFLEQYYEKATDIPQEILIPHTVESAEMLEELLQKMKGTRVKITVPERGRKNELLQLSLENAQNFSKLKEIKWQGTQKTDRQNALEKLQNLLKLEKLPKRLECYDISHFGGTETVSSMVVFENGFPAKNLYRKFKLHQETSGAPDDFASMEETLTRRLKYLKPSALTGNVTLKKGEYEVTEKNGKALITKLPVLTESTALTTAIKKLAEKQKKKRIYVVVPPQQKELYEEAGCQPVRKIPDVFMNLGKIAKPEDIYVYDTNKYREDASFKQKPDLIIIDGGKGQLGRAVKAAKKYNLNVPMISIAKKYEELFVPGESTSILLPKDSPVLHLIQHLRDESHRFAGSYHSNLQLKDTKSSALDNIFGLGEKNKMKLLRHFGSPEAIKNATMHELELVVGKKIAMTVKTANF